MKNENMEKIEIKEENEFKIILNLIREDTEKWPDWKKEIFEEKYSNISRMYLAKNS